MLIDMEYDTDTLTTVACKNRAASKKLFQQLQQQQVSHTSRLFLVYDADASYSDDDDGGMDDDAAAAVASSTNGFAAAGARCPLANTHRHHRHHNNHVPN